MQEQLENILADLVRIPSVSDDTVACQAIIGYVREQLEPLGLHMTAETETAHPWLLATTRATDKPKILLVAHLDVVPGDESQFELHKTPERLYGRGAWDMKYAAAGYLEFLKAYENKLAEFDLGVLFTTDEEIGGFQGAAEVLRQGWRTDLALIPDYRDNWHVEANAKGAFIAKITAGGTNAHGSRPWEGDNAVQKLVPFLHELQNLYPSRDKAGPTLSANMVSGGVAFNQIPDEACAWLDFRAFHAKEIDGYKRTLRQLADESGFTVEEIISSDPVVLNKRDPLVKQYMRSLEANGITPAYQKSFGGSDARWFARYGISCIVTGPHGDGAHGSNEWMQRGDLLTFYRILEHFLGKNAYARENAAERIAG